VTGPRYVVAVLIALSSSSAARADEPPPTAAAVIDQLVDNAQQRAAQPSIVEPFAGAVTSGGNPATAGLIITSLINDEAARAEEALYRKMLDAMDARWSKQVGAAPGGTATTAVASKGIVPDILGVAVERGAITREDEGSSVTFRATPMGVLQALNGEDLGDMFKARSRSGSLRGLSRLSAAVTFDTDLGDSAGELTADRQQLTTWSVRYTPIDRRDPGSPRYAHLWHGLAHRSSAYVSARLEIVGHLAAWPEFAAWQTGLVAEAQAIDARIAPDRNAASIADAKAEFRALLERRLPELSELPGMPPAVKAALDTYVTELTEVQGGLAGIEAFAAKGAVATLDWTTTRDATLPDLYTVTGVLDVGVGPQRRDDFTLNVGLSFYREAPADAQRTFKSFVASTEYSRALGRVRDTPIRLSLSGRFERLPEDVAVPLAADDASSAAPLPAAVAPKGNIFVAQAKVTIPMGKGGSIKVPLAVTFSNRTELIKEKDVRANFGFTFDLDSLLGGLSL
jgi:hypothetical protein